MSNLPITIELNESTEATSLALDFRFYIPERCRDAFENVNADYGKEFFDRLLKEVQLNVTAMVMAHAVTGLTEAFTPKTTIKVSEGNPSTNDDDDGKEEDYPDFPITDEQRTLLKEKGCFVANSDQVKELLSKGDPKVVTLQECLEELTPAQREEQAKTGCVKVTGPQMCKLIRDAANKGKAMRRLQGLELTQTQQDRLAKSGFFVATYAQTLELFGDDPEAKAEYEQQLREAFFEMQANNQRVYTK